MGLPILFIQQYFTEPSDTLTSAIRTIWINPYRARKQGDGFYIYYCYLRFDICFFHCLNFVCFV